VLGTYVSDELPLYSGVITVLADEAKLLKSPDITLVCVGSCISFLTSSIHGPVAPKCSLVSGFISACFDSGAIFVNNPLVGPPAHLFVPEFDIQCDILLKQSFLHEGAAESPGIHVCVVLHQPHNSDW